MNASLDPAEVESLLKAIEPGEEASSPGAVPWDFKRPERVSKEQLGALANLHEVFARSFGASLSGLLRSVTEVRLASVSQMTYSEFVAALPNPTCFTVFSCKPLAGNMMIEFGQSLMFPVIDRLLGGGRSLATLPERPLTAIEWTLATTIARRALLDLEAMWSSVRKLTFEPLFARSNPFLLQSMPPNELVVSVEFTVKVGTEEGRAHLCIPFVTIEPLVGEVEAHSWYPSAGATAALPAVRGPLSDAVVALTAVLAETTVTVRELLNLEPGDIIETRQNAASPITIRVEGLPKFAGRPVACRNKYAVEVSGSGVRES